MQLRTKNIINRDVSQPHIDSMTTVLFVRNLHLGGSVCMVSYVDCMWREKVLEAGEFGERVISFSLPTMQY